jgi:hypothetical protein
MLGSIYMTTARCYNAEGHNMNLRCGEILKSHKLGPRNYSQTVTFLIYICEVSGSNFGRDTFSCD